MANNRTKGNNVNFARQHPTEEHLKEEQHPIKVSKLQFRRRIFNLEFKLTLRQEFWCWRMAFHNIGMRAVREVYLSEGNYGYQNTMSCKLKKNNNAMAYVKRLKELGKQNKIGLVHGPWKHFSKFISRELIDTEIEGTGLLKLDI